MECLTTIEGSEAVSMQFEPLINIKGRRQSEKATEAISRESSSYHEVNPETIEIDQRPKSKQPHQFYFVKIWPSSEDLNLNANIEGMERLIHEKKTALVKRLDERKSDKDRLYQVLTSPYYNRNLYELDTIAPYDIQIENLERTLHELSFSKKPRPRTARFLCKNDEDLREHIHGGHYTSQISLKLCRNRYLDRMARDRIDVKYLQQAREFYSSMEVEPTSTGTINCVHSPKEELNGLIESLCYRIRHGSNSLVEEKKFLEEIKQADSTREKHTSIRDQFGGSKEAIQNESKRMSKAMNRQNNWLDSHNANVRRLKENIEIAENDISSLQKELDDINDIESQNIPTKSKYYRRRNEVHKYIFELKKHNDTLQSSCYHLYLSLINNANELARKKNVAVLKELSHRQVEDYMSQWNNSNAFKNNYMESISISLGTS